jgi:hypothetical protein
VPGYIIVFKESATKDQIDEYMKRILESGATCPLYFDSYRFIDIRVGGSIKYSYDSLMKAVAATVSESFVNSFGKDDIVDFIGR